MAPVSDNSRMHTILIIDDDEPILATFGFTLENAGYHAIMAHGGVEGLDQISKQVPDVILCDVNMPGMNGWEVLKRVRADPDTAHVQFVLMTGNLRDIKPRTGMEVGADDFLVKPFGQQELLNAVEARLHRADVHRKLAQDAAKSVRTNLRSTLPHEFFTPLAGILGIVELLRDKDAPLSPEDTDEFLTEIQQAGWRLHRTLNNYFTALNLEQTSPAEEILPDLAHDRLKKAVQNGIEAAVKRHGRERDLEILLADTSIRGVSADVSVITEELVENACVYSPPGTLIRVELSASGTLTVSDEGRGMSRDQIREVDAFRQFDRKKYEQQGLGLGLFLVQRIAANSGATFEIDSAPDQGTRVTVGFVRGGE
jgi:signal transduction histidine kinase